MAAYTSTQAGDFNTDATWGGGGHPTTAADTASIGHAVTAAAGITCGAITLTGGSLNTGTAAATITSINVASGNGSVTIGSGGCTFAGVFTAVGTGAFTVGGACTGVTTFTTPTGTNAVNAALTCSGVATFNGNTTIAAGITFTCQTSFAIATAKTLTLADGASLVGMTAESTLASSTGALVVGAGCTVSTSSVSDIGIKCVNSLCTITVNGTAVSRSTFTNAGAGGFYIDGGTVTLNYCDVHRGASGTSLAALCAKNADMVLRGVGVDIEGTITGGYGIRCSYGVTCNLRDSFITGCTAGLYSANASPGTFQLDNVDFTKDVSGNSQPNTTDINFSRPVYVEAKGVRLGGGTTITGTGTLLIADDFGHIAGDANPPGIGYIYDGNTGTIQRSTSAKNAGDYGARMTPNPSGTGNIHLLQPLEMEIRVPLQSGDSLTVSGTARKMAGTSMPAPSLAVRIDPEKSWFSTVNSWETTLPADGTFGSFSVASSGAGGMLQKGSCRVVFRLKSGPASNDGTYVDIADVVATVTRATGGTVAYVFSMQNWQGGSPIADAPAVSTGGGGFVIMDA